MQQRKKSLLPFNKCKNDSHHLKNSLYMSVVAVVVAVAAAVAASVAVVIQFNAVLIH
jgi:hypothetical protein